MRRKISALLLILAMLFSFIVIVIEIAPMVDAPTIYVDDDNTGVEDGSQANPWNTIQEAVDVAQPGDTVYVNNGTYNEHVIVNKPLNLVGASRDNTTIDAGGSGDAIKPTVDWVNVTGFNLTGAGSGDEEAGVDLFSVCHCRIINNTVSFSGKHGINIRMSANNHIIKNNKVISNNVNGIYIWGSSNNVIIGNNMSGNMGGAYLGFSDYNTITYNTIWKNSGNGITLMESSNNSISSNYVLMKGVSAAENGIRITGSSDNRVTNNNVSLSGGEGIEVVSSSQDNMIVANNISWSTWRGIVFMSSSNNRIYHNNIVGNGIQAEDNSNNQWDDGYPSGGNYWSDYSGIDLNSTPDQDVPPPDGIGDTPHVIDADSKDNYPFIKPYLFENYTVLKRGWNLISIPLIQNEQNLTKVLDDINGLYDAVRWYDPTDTDDPWKQTKIGKAFGNDLNELNETMGFWVHVITSGGIIFLYNGTTPVTSQKIQLYNGWNLVGYPSLTSYNRTDGLNNTEFGTHINEIMWYDASSKTWRAMGEDDYFRKGTGYWFNAKEEIVWHVPL